MSKSHKKQKRRNKRTVAVKSPAVTTAAQQKFNGLSKRGLRAYADLAAMDRRFKILYLIPHRPQDISEASLLGWYTPALHHAAGPLMTAACLPKDIRELFSAPDVVLPHRLARRIWSTATPIELDALIAEADRLKGPFRVFLSNNPTVANDIDAFIAQSGWFCLHVSSVIGEGRVLVGDFSLNILSDYCRKVIEALLSVPEWAEFANIAKIETANKPLRKWRSHQLPRGLHNVTTPNELALKAFGWSLSRVDRISTPLTPGGNNPRRYVERICQSADAVMAARTQLMKQLNPGMLDYRYIIAVQSMYWAHFHDWRKRIQNFKGANKDALRFAYSLAIQSTSYFNSINENNLELMDSQFFKFIQGQREADGLSFTAGLTVLSTASLAPVLRLEPRLNQVRGDLKQLANCVRAKASHHFDWKQSRMTHRLSGKMRSLVDTSFLTRIDKPEQRGLIEGLKLVTDLPLELMFSNGLPLSMRYDVSRLSVLPGNLYLMGCLTPPLMVPLSAFSEVLIIRSFQPDDPLRKILEISISAALEITPTPSTLGVKTRFVDVQDEDELVAALHNYNGALMIFDGHGSYDSNTGGGVIVIGGKKVDAWQLKERCSFPPIVIFSACDTQPIDGGHSSVATAAFTLEAHTVLATTLPIHGMKAGAFIGRLLYRIAEFMPLAVKVRPILTWREVISGMLRMTHVTEVMAALKKNAGLAYQGINFDAAQLSANTAINQRSPDWHEKFLDKLSVLTGKSIDHLKRDIEQWASITDSMKYIQLGNPESIVIIEKNAEEIFEKEASGLQPLH